MTKKSVSELIDKIIETKKIKLEKQFSPTISLKSRDGKELNFRNKAFFIELSTIVEQEILKNVIKKGDNIDYVTLIGSKKVQGSGFVKNIVFRETLNKFIIVDIETKDRGIVKIIFKKSRYPEDDIFLK